MKIYRNNAQAYDIRPEQSSTQRTVHMGEDVLNINFKTTTSLVLRINDYVVYKNKKYKFKKLPNPKKNSKNDFEYICTLYSPIYDLQDVLFRLQDNTGLGELEDFPVHGTASFHLNQIVRNARTVHSSFSVGAVSQTSEEKNITYTGLDCFAALQKLADAFGMEYWLTGYAVHLGKRQEGVPLLFKYGKGNSLYDLSRQTLDGRIVTRLYVKGSEKNISTAYGSKSLLLPAKAKYIEQNVGKYGIIEGMQAFENVYPRLINKNYGDPGSVTSLRVEEGIYYIKDTFLNFNPADFLLPGLSLKIVFQTGQLSGYHVEANYKAATKEFELIKNNYENNIEMPASIFIPKVGDKYLLEDLKMPQAYIVAAEVELLQKATEHLKTICEQKVTYKGTVNPLYFKKLGQNIETGRAVTVDDNDIVDNATVSLRIQAFTRNLNDEYDIDVEISDTLYVSRVDKIETEVDQIKEDQEAANKKGNSMSRRLWRDVIETNDMLYDPDGELTERIKALSLQVTQLIVGTNSSQFDLVGIKFQANYKGDHNRFNYTGGKLVHHTIKEGLAVSWSFDEGNGATLLNSNFAYYVYARCSKTGISGNIILSTTPILLLQEDGWYHFWVGVINTPKTITASGGKVSTSRSFQAIHGFTEIVGDNITTGLIKSADGRTFIDLRTGEITGNITFLAGSKGWEYIAGLMTEFSQLNDLLGETWDLADIAATKAELARISASGANAEAAKANTLLAIYEAVFENNTSVIGGLILTSMIQMRKGDQVQAGISANLNNNNLAFWAGGTHEQGLHLIGGWETDKAKLAITHDGTLFAENAYIKGRIEATSGSFKGEIEATSGKIGDWTIDKGLKFTGSYEKTPSIEIKTNIHDITLGKKTSEVLESGGYRNFDTHLYIGDKSPIKSYSTNAISVWYSEPGAIYNQIALNTNRFMSCRYVKQTHNIGYAWQEGVVWRIQGLPSSLLVINTPILFDYAQNWIFRSNDKNKLIDLPTVFQIQHRYRQADGSTTSRDEVRYAFGFTFTLFCHRESNSLILRGTLGCPLLDGNGNAGYEHLMASGDAITLAYTQEAYYIVSINQ